jgi:hypothetical protein
LHIGNHRSDRSRLRSRGTRRRGILLSLAMLLLALLLLPREPAAQSASLRVGLYQNSPKIFIDDAGKARGFFPELIDRLAAKNGWTITYVPCAWADCLDMLAHGEIDIMPDVAKSSDRMDRFPFGYEAVLTTWSHLYVRPNARLDDITGIDGKRVAVLENSIQHRDLLAVMATANINPDIITTSSFQGVLQAVADSAADIGIVNRFYGLAHEADFPVKRTDVIFSPSAVYFAFASTVSSNLIGKIDIDLAMLKADATSPYYALIDKWLKPRLSESVPAWVYWLVAGLGVMLAGSLAAASYMRHRIAEGTAQLRAAMEEATAANRAKSAFLANMSHDLRTPLNSILGFSEAMQRQLFGPLGDHRYVEYVGNIHRSGQHLINLVNDILDLSKIECGKYEIAETWFDVAAELAEAKTRIAAAVQDAGPRIHLAAEAGELFADRRAVVQIIDNLLSNAVKHAGAGASITVGWAVGPGGAGDIFVADTGKGIPEAELPRIAEPFFQGSGDRAQKPLTARNADGIGLGLSIVSHLARIHSAVLTIESTVGKGSTFTVRFPAERLDRRHNTAERRRALRRAPVL